MFFLLKDHLQSDSFIGRKRLFLFEFLYLPSFSLSLSSSCSTPTISSRYDNDIAVLWPQIGQNTTADERLNIPYLDISDKLTVRMNPEEERLHFWDAMVNKYNGRLLQ